MNQNNGNPRNVAVVDVIEDDQPPDSTGTFYDSSNPILKPAKEINTARKKSWKRRLIGWSFILLLIGGGAIALYLLLKVNRVNVRVQADSRRDSQSAKDNPPSNTPDNNLTAEAINIARAAGGADTSPSNNANPTASSTPAPSPSPGANVGRDLSFTGNSSPVFDSFNDGNSNSNANQQQNGNGTQHQKAIGELSSPIQTHANSTQSIFVDDTSPKLATAAHPVGANPGAPRLDRKAPEKPKTPPAVLPPFGTMLPVRTQGVIFTLRNNSYARLELTRDSAGVGWSLPKGTVLVGRTAGSEYDRAFVNVIGYIDPRDNKLVKMSGDVLGSDGATGISGKRIGVDRNRLKQTLRKVASSGVQLAGMMAGALGRGTVVLDGAGYRVLNPISDEARRMVGGGDAKSTFVKVEAGRPAYVMVADLPKSLQAVDAPGEDALAGAALSLTDREVMELILFGTPEEVNAAAPLMTEEQKQLTLKTRPEIERK